MRIYKFRGFHADEHGKTVIKLDGKEIKGTWLYGDLHTDGPYINEHKVLPETVGQYSGIPDIHGKEIFDGDILSKFSNYAGKKIIKPVVFELGIFFWKYSDSAAEPLYDVRDRAEIIGNIFESPELVEVEE